MQLCEKCHKEAPGLREVLQLKCVIILAEVARQLWASRGHKIARSLAVWKRMDGILQGEREALWKAGVEVVRQVGSFRPQAISPTEWGAVCRGKRPIGSLFFQAPSKKLVAPSTLPPSIE